MMKIIRVFLPVLWIFIFHINIYALDKNMEVTFFKVGQGACSLASFKEGPSVLIDAGSSQIPGVSQREKKAFKDITIQTIIQKIQKPKNNRKWTVDLYVIVSHGDQDHYNWVQDIVMNIPSYSYWRIQFLLGGQETDYSPNFQKFVKPYRTEKRGGYVITDHATRHFFERRDQQPYPTVLPG